MLPVPARHCTPSGVFGPLTRLSDPHMTRQLPRRGRCGMVGRGALGRHGRVSPSGRTSTPAPAAARSAGSAWAAWMRQGRLRPTRRTHSQATAVASARRAAAVRAERGDAPAMLQLTDALGQVHGEGGVGRGVWGVGGGGRSMRSRCRQRSAVGVLVDEAHAQFPHSPAQGAALHRA